MKQLKLISRYHSTSLPSMYSPLYFMYNGKKYKTRNNDNLMPTNIYKKEKTSSLYMVPKQYRKVDPDNVW